MRLLQCPICLEDTKRRWLHDFKAIGCESCGLAYKNELGTTKDLYDYYRYDYWFERKVDTKRLFNRSIRLVCTIAQFVPEVSRHLDIGSSNGWLLDAIQTVWLNESVGVELCQFARDECTTEAKLYETIDDIPSSEKKFDLITMSHVLEHLPEPMPMLQKIWSHLRKRDGLFVCEVPNFPGEPTALPPKMGTHVLGFSQESLRICMQKAGFHVREIQTALPFKEPWGVRPPAYLTAICTAKSRTLVEEKRIFAQYNIEDNSLGAAYMGDASFIKDNI